jgi:hypothetical protein
MGFDYKMKNPESGAICMISGESGQEYEFLRRNKIVPPEREDQKGDYYGIISQIGLNYGLPSFRPPKRTH